MKALIVVESMFGNTRSIADAVANTLEPWMTVDVVAVQDAPDDVSPETGLLVVCGPTHAFGMSRLTTRQDAVKRGATVQTGRGLREWLGGLDQLPPGLSAAAFDTRVSRPFVPGSAARAAARLLRQLGCAVIVSPETFHIDATVGPVSNGEIARARSWGAHLADALVADGSVGQSA